MRVLPAGSVTRFKLCLKTCVIHSRLGAMLALYGLRPPAPLALHPVSECLRSAAFHGSAVRRTTAASPRGRAASPRPAPRAHGVVRELIRTPAAAEGRGQAQTGAHFRHSESAARPRRGRSSSGSAPSAGEADASSRATRGRAGGRSCGAAPGVDPVVPQNRSMWRVCCALVYLWHSSYAPLLSVSADTRRSHQNVTSMIWPVGGHGAG